MTPPDPQEREAHVLPCPFCGEALAANNNQRDMYVRRYGTHYSHSGMDCYRFTPITVHDGYFVYHAEMQPNPAGDWVPFDAARDVAASPPPPTGQLSLDADSGHEAERLADSLGASPAGTGLCGLRPEPQGVSALRAPIPGANSPRAACAEILSVIERVENRCMACDGPVTPTSQEITEHDLRQIYRAAKRGAA